MTTYNIGPGQTYTTFTALEAAVVLAGDDIVDGGDNTFTETWTPATSGTAGHPITLRNFTIDGQSVRANCLNLTGLSWISIDSFATSGATTVDINYGTAANILLTNWTGTGAVRALDCAAGGSNLTIDTATLSGYSPPSRGALSCNYTGANLTLRHVTVTGGWRAIYSTAASGVTMEDVQATGAVNLHGIEIANVTSGTVALTDIYAGVTRLGAAGGNATTGLYLNNCDGCVLTATGIHASNNGQRGVYVFGCNLSAGSTLADSEMADNTLEGLYINGSPNLAVSDVTATGNATDGVLVEGAAASGVVLTRITATGNTDDGIAAVTSVPDLLIQYATASTNGKDGINVSGGAVLDIWYSVANGNGTDDVAGSGDGFTGHDTAVMNLFYCIAANNLNTGVAHVTATSGLIYHCTFANNGRADNTAAVRAGMFLTTTHATGFTVRNCISSGNYPCELYESATSNNDLNYNCWNPLDSDQFYTQDGATYDSWTTYHTTDGNEPNSINSDPLFAGTSDYSLLTGSPCINVGVNLGAAYDDGLDPDSVWPSAVVTADQNDYDSWEIGAYVYTELTETTPTSSTAVRDLTSQITVLTYRNTGTEVLVLQGVVEFGDGTDDLDGTGGEFEFTMQFDSQTNMPDPQHITFSTATRASVFTEQFPLPVGQTVTFKVKSPNAADTAVWTRATVYEVGVESLREDILAIVNKQRQTKQIYDNSSGGGGVYPVTTGSTSGVYVSRC